MPSDRFGVHVSIAGGVSKAFAQGERLTCSTIQIFTKNERQWKTKPLAADEVAAYRQEQARSGIGPVLVHDSYIINMGSPKDDLWERSTVAFGDELERCAALDIPYIVTHPGAHTGSGEAAGLQRQADALNRLFAAETGGSVTVLLETTAGQGTALGWRFEHLARLLELVRYPERVAVCVDTCHIFVAGYDLRDAESYAATFAEFDRLVGLEHIKAFHVNDAQQGLGSRVDRHAHIGKGAIGLEGFRLLVNDARFRDVPMILETPAGKDRAEDLENLAQVRALQAETEEGAPPQ